MKRKLISSFIAGFLCFIVSMSGILGFLDHFLTDTLYQKPLPVNNNIKIIAIDEKSMEALGPFNTWSRDYYAQLLNRLYEDPEYSPKATAFDIIFQGETDPLADKALADAAKKAGNVVCAANLVFRDKVEYDTNGKAFLNRFYTEMVEYPYPSLNECVRSGSADTIQDSRDLKIRQFIPVFEGDGTIPTLSLAVARVLKEEGSAEVLLPYTAPSESLIIRYTGRSGDYEAISFSDVLEGNIPKEIFKNSIVFVGAYAPGMMDAYEVPSDSGTLMYGVEIHANILEAITNGRYMKNVSSILYSLVYALLVFIFTLIALNIKPVLSGITAVIITAIQIMAGCRAASAHLFLPLLVLPLFLVIAWVGALLANYLSSVLQRRKVLKAFKQYVAPQIVEEISKSGNFELSLGGRNRDIAVLFVDIRGFTPLSEALSPEQVVEVLNEYLTLTTTAIFNNLGTLDKFVGDATMAVFNSPFDLDDYVYRAVCTARDIVAGSEDIRRKAFEMTGKEVGFGVGVNCGPAIVGNIGCDFRMDYTAIGDTVNTAARLEANAPAGEVLLSQAVLDALGDRIRVTEKGTIPLKGKKVPIMVYKLEEVL